MQPPTDAQLVELARTGDRPAFDDLICRHQASAARVACLLVGDRFEAEDLAQEAFLRAWQNLHVLNDPSKFAAWLRRIVFGISIDWLRAFRSDLFRLADESSEIALFSYPSSSGNALEMLESSDLRQRVWAAVERLPERYRVPLTMFHFDGLSHARVAQALNVSESTVRSLVTRARAKLRPMLADHTEMLLPAMQDLLQEQTMDKTALLNLVDGDSVGGTLSQSGIPGEIVVYGDLIYEGPAPSGLAAEEWIAVRSKFYADAGYGSAAGVAEFLRKGEQAIDKLAQYRELIVWFDHHLMDQILLIKLLDTFSRTATQTSLSLICIGEYPGVKPFISLGQLTADQLYSLGDTRTEIADGQLRLGQKAWQAFTSVDPRSIEALLAEDTSALPFLARALRRHLQQFPSLENGLSWTEQTALEVLRDQGTLAAGRLYGSVQRREELLFMGDYSFYRILRQLASGKSPLIDASGLPAMIEEWSGVAVSMSASGRRVLEGLTDRIALNGIDEWLGGVHFRDGQPLWRWDRKRERLVQS